MESATNSLIQRSNPLRSALLKFGDHNIRFCHWKSNRNLVDALEGKDDFDLLVHPDDVDQAINQLTSSGFRLMKTDFDFFQPKLKHFYAFGTEGQKFHVHLYPEIWTGDTFLKNFSIPNVEWILRNTISKEGVPIPNPGVESVLLTLRIYLKVVHLSDWIFLRRDLSGLLKEWNQLVAERSLKQVEAYLEACFPNISTKFWAQLEYALQHRFNLFTIITLGFRLKSKLRSIQRFGVVRASLYRAGIIGRLVQKRLWGRKMIRPTHFPRVIAFVGPPATGKSTLLEETKRWLAKFVNVKSIHVGRPPSSILTLPINFLLPAFRRLMPSRRSTKMDIANIKVGERGLIFAIRMVILAFDRRQLLLKMKQDLERDDIVYLCDRYPSYQEGSVDGRQFTDEDIRKTRLGLLRIAMRIERYLYRDLPAPDVVVRLSVPLDIALIRNQKRSKALPQSSEFVEMRHRQYSELLYRTTDVLDVNTNQPLDTTLSLIRSFIWSRQI